MKMKYSRKSIKMCLPCMMQQLLQIYCLEAVNNTWQLMCGVCWDPSLFQLHEESCFKLRLILTWVKTTLSCHTSFNGVVFGKYINQHGVNLVPLAEQKHHSLLTMIKLYRCLLKMRGIGSLHMDHDFLIDKIPKPHIIPISQIFLVPPSA